MATATPVALVLGAGKNIGHHVGKAFAAKGYKIALAARSLKEEDSTADQLNIQSDFTDSDSIIKVFARVKSHFGPPSVVVYNGAALTVNDANDPLSLPLVDFARDLKVNTTSAFVAAQQSVLAFAELPGSAARAFIYTGNILNTKTIPTVLDLGVGKSATSHIIETAAAAYKGKGYKFHYADERNEDGSPASMAIDGPAHAKFYVELAEGTSKADWHATFVKGIGYKKF